ncbi:hypothetical protein BDV36DRAFT_244160, partial [Aspergillus pseudocaelatus]
MHHRNEATTAEISFPIIFALVGFPFASALIDKSHFAGDSLRPKRWVFQERLTGFTPSSYYHPILLLLLRSTIYYYYTTRYGESYGLKSLDL